MKKTNMPFLLLTVAALPACAQYAGNNALTFNGTNQFVAVPTLALSNRSFTVETWLRRDTTNRWDIFLTQGTNVNHNGLHIGFRSNNLFTLGFYGNDLDYTTPFTDTNWHHWAMTYDSVTRIRRIYLDGDVAAEDLPTTAYQGSGPLRLASMPFAPISFFRGALDELRVWTIARSQAEIQATRNRTLTGTEPDLALYYRFDAIVGSVVTNLAVTGAAWDGALGNSPALVTGAPVSSVPVAVTLPVIAWGPGYAYMRGSVDPSGATTAYFFRYGTTTNYGSISGGSTVFATQTVSILVMRLVPGTLYHCQLVVSNSAGLSAGADRTFTTPLFSNPTELWGTNDFIIADGGAGLVVLNPDLTFKSVQDTAGPPLSGLMAGSLDWFANGDLLVANRWIGYSPTAFRYGRHGDQLAYYRYFGQPADGIIGPCDTKVSFTQKDFMAADYGTFGPSVMRYALGGVPQEATTNYTYGGLAVVPRTNGTHELWVAMDPDFTGIMIFAMNAAGQVLFNQGPVAYPTVPATCVTMTYDPATRRVLFANEGAAQILAMDVETRTVARTYNIPAGQSPGVIFTGLTAGPGGMVVAVESYDHLVVTGSRRVGLSVWDADGSNYRFINLDGFPGFDLVDSANGWMPMNIVWAGNCPAPTVSNLTLTNGNFSGAVNGIEGVNYLVQGATNLAAPAWENLATNAPPFQFTEPATRPSRFYRAVPQTGFIP